MRIKRLELKIEFDQTSMHVFHSGYDTYEEPPTIVSINGNEYEGKVSLIMSDDIYELRIEKI